MPGKGVFGSECLDPPLDLTEWQYATLVIRGDAKNGGLTLPSFSPHQKGFVRTECCAALGSAIDGIFETLRGNIATDMPKALQQQTFPETSIH